MVNWEYKIVSEHIEHSGKLENLINELATAEWEPINISIGEEQVICLLRKPKDMRSRTDRW